MTRKTPLLFKKDEKDKHVSVFKPRAKYGSGFTLIELLVVIVIIGLLMAILIPVTGRAREQARRAACSNNLRQLVIAMTMYADDHNGYPVRVTVFVGSLQIPAKNWFARWSDYLWIPPQRPHDVGLLYEENYIDDLNIFYCPSARWMKDHPTEYGPDTYGVPGGTSRMPYIYWEWCDFVAADPATWTAHKFDGSHNMVIFSDRYRAVGLPPFNVNHEGKRGFVQGNVAFGDGSVRWYSKNGWTDLELVNAGDEY